MPFSTKAKRDRARKRIALRVKAGEPCCFCGQPDRPVRALPRTRESFVVDHQVPTQPGGSDHYDGASPSHNHATDSAATSPTAASAATAVSSAETGLGQVPPEGVPNADLGRP